MATVRERPAAPAGARRGQTSPCVTPCRGSCATRSRPASGARTAHAGSSPTAARAATAAGSCASPSMPARATSCCSRCRPTRATSPAAPTPWWSRRFWHDASGAAARLGPRLLRRRRSPAFVRRPLALSGRGDRAAGALRPALVAHRTRPLARLAPLPGGEGPGAPAAPGGRLGAAGALGRPVGQPRPLRRAVPPCGRGGGGAGLSARADPHPRQAPAGPRGRRRGGPAHPRRLAGALPGRRPRGTAWGSASPSTSAPASRARSSTTRPSCSGRTAS